MELMQHFVYVVAISKANAWQNLNNMQMSAFGVYNLTYIWLKLLIIWRSFRFWAWCDGVVAVENMSRCMYDSYSGIDFWRYWHQSYNRWLIRYVYIPLGGSKLRMYNMWAVFTFVAIWHDITLKLLFWGWLICIFIVPELALTWVSNRLKWHDSPYHRHFVALGYSLNLILMVVVNMLGFAVQDFKDVPAIVQRIFLSQPLFIVPLIVIAYMLAAISIEIRRTESL